MAGLFDPLDIGDLRLPNRIVMAPMTRTRAPGPGRVPNALMAEYYAQRASAGLIVTEGVCVGPMAIGYKYVPGIWTDEQTEGWASVTEAVHAAGGRIFLQLWHVGRISDPIHLDGRLPVAPSAIPAPGHIRHVRPERPYVVPRALETGEIADIVEEFRHGAENARKAGFDGVELHGANGYLFDQFLRGGANRRTDDYGGSIENRARLLLEATDAAISVWGAGRVGVHIAPRQDQGLTDDDLPSLYCYLADELGKRRIGFLMAREHEGPDAIGPMLRKRFGGVFIANEGFSRDSASHVLEAGDADAVGFGRAYIANPDLVERFRRDAPLNPLDSTTIYSRGSAGYTDYPALDVGLVPVES